jgi:glycosyltransferase involved in cell wall biosynthesis
LKAVWNNPQPWDSPIQIGAHHYVRCLVERGWDVAYITTPISPFHVMNWQYLAETKQRLRNWWRGGEPALGGKLLCYTPMTVLPHYDAPLLRSAWTLDGWSHLTLPGIRRWLSQHGFDEPDLLVIDSVVQSFWLDCLRPRKSVLRICDRLSGFRAVTAAMLKRESELIQRVDHVIYTATAMEEEIAARQPKKMTCVPNGVDLSHFQQNTSPPPPEYLSIPEPRAIYVGAVDAWFDTELLASFAQKLSHVSFVVVGPCRIDLTPLKRRSNVYCLGRRAYEEVPAFMRHAQVGLIPFRVNELVNAVSPIKLFEYFACGLPVVSVAWKELTHLNSPAVLCSTADEFAAAIQSSITRPVERTQLLQYAADSEWRRRLAQMLRAMELS